jgi:uncharacterized protein with FMN-binding domain
VSLVRKFALALASLFTLVGFTLAAEVVFVKFDKEKNEVTVKEGDKEATYKVSEDTKLTVGEKTKDGKFDGEKVFGKAKEGKTKFDITVDGGKITEIKMKGKK